MEVLREEKAWDSKHCHTAVLQLGFPELIHLLLVSAASETSGVKALLERLCGGGRAGTYGFEQ